MDRFKFAELGRVYLRIAIKPFDSVTLSPVRFKVDTGADSSTISKNRLHQLGFTEEWILGNATEAGEVSTAAGETYMKYVIQLPLINLLGYEGKEWPFAILLDTVDTAGKPVKQDFRNLLGRDLLTGFNLYI